jgi:transposase
VVQIKALACELPRAHQQPLSRWSVSDLSRYAQRCGLVATISESTIWRWLNQDAIRPWRFRCWIFPRDPLFAPKAGRVLDLYHRLWDGQPLGEGEFVLSADEKTSIQARRRKHLSYPPQPGSVMKVEHEYTRCGAWAYMAAIDVHRAKLFGRCERRNGIASFDRLVEQVMTQAPYRRAKRVFWILDNGSSHRGQRCITRLQGRYPNLMVVHAPIHASWLNQIEIYFSILQRKLLTPNDFKSLKDLEQHLMDFQTYYEQIAKPFEWKFTRQDLTALLNKLKPASLTIERLAA